MLSKNFRLVLIGAVIALSLILAGVWAWPKPEEVDETDQLRSQIESQIASLQTKEHFLEVVSNEGDFAREVDSLNQSSADLEILLTRVQNANLPETTSQQYSTKLVQALEHNQYKTCFLNRFQSELNLVQQQTKLAADPTPENQQTLGQLYKQRLDSLNQTEECFARERAIFALNSTSTDLQRNRFWLEQQSAQTGQMTPTPQPMVMDFFGEQNLRALEKQADQVLHSRSTPNLDRSSFKRGWLGKKKVGYWLTKFTNRLKNWPAI